ncbi:hypothetical protein ACS0TY_014871 [Phlomoides rotata]
MKHTRARNVVERTFGLLKMRWGILRSPSWYLIKMANQIIMACCYIRNYIRMETDADPLEGGMDEYMSTEPNQTKQCRNGPHGETILRRTCGMSGIIIMEFRAGLMDPRGNPVGPDVDRVKNARGRRSWSRVEEDALIHRLTDIVNDGWKAENGFRAGFQIEFERGMRRRLTGTDIVANPHIN